MQILKTGYTYIEVLIAMLLLSTIFLVILDIEVLSLRQSQRIFLDTFSTIELVNMLERLRATHSSSTRANESVFWNKSLHELSPEFSGQYYCLLNSCDIFIKGKSFSSNLKTYD